MLLATEDAPVEEVAVAEEEEEEVNIVIRI